MDSDNQTVIPLIVMSMKVKLWGVRGSLPAPHPPDVIEARIKKALQRFIAEGFSRPTDVDKFMEALTPQMAGGYGGNTACVEVFNGKQSLIIDGGSGLRLLGERLMSGPCGVGRGEAHLLFTHFHWDHLIGVPFFIPLFVPGNVVHLYAVQPDLESVIRGLFQRPQFPVPFKDLQATVQFHKLEPRKMTEINGMEVTPYKLDHPDPCWGYRVEVNGKSYAHCVDTECTRVSAADLGSDLPLYQNADLMLFDAQYTLLEAVEKMNWGHSAAPIGLDIALRENVKQILFAHHDPGASDDKVADAERQTRDYLEAYRENARAAGKIVPEIKWGFAREGQVIEIT